MPTSVYEEVVVQGNDRPGISAVRDAEWLIVRSPTFSSPIPVSLMGLDIGEQDVIRLGQEVGVDWLIIDERLGRKIAQTMGFRVKGTLGLLLAAYQLGLLTQQEAYDAAETLNERSIRLSPQLVEWFQTQLNIENY